MSTPFILAGLTLVAMVFAGRWAQSCLSEAASKLEAQGFDMDRTFGWKELNAADRTLCRKYRISLTVFGILGIVFVMLLLLGLGLFNS